MKPIMDYESFGPTQSTVAPRGRRGGIAAAELIISAVLLITVMSFVTTICFRINLVWKDINHHRVAMGELSNQLEELTQLSPQEARTAVDSLKPTAICARSLQNPEITGEVVDDELGSRILLQLNWKRSNPGKAVELVGWIVPEATQ